MLVARSAAEVQDLLSALEAARTRGLHAAGYLAYEAGKGLAPAWRGAADATAAGRAPLGWFGLFESVEGIRTEAHRGGEGCVCSCSSRCSPYYITKNTLIC